MNNNSTPEFLKLYLPNKEYTRNSNGEVMVQNIPGSYSAENYKNIIHGIKNIKSVIDSITYDNVIRFTKGSSVHVHFDHLVYTSYYVKKFLTSLCFNISGNNLFTGIVVAFQCC